MKVIITVKFFKTGTGKFSHEESFIGMCNSFDPNGIEAAVKERYDLRAAMDIVYEAWNQQRNLYTAALIKSA